MKKKHHHKNKPGFFKKWSAKLHLWFGLGIGFLIFIISITGALYVFKDELENFTRKDVIYHNEQNIEQKNVLPIRMMEKSVVEQVKEKYPVHWVNVPIDKRDLIFFIGMNTTRRPGIILMNCRFIKPLM
ncbi:Uncharacterized iron-regulated membrane protein [Chryseobacterium carnipullorum]|uniref:Uncharacterized iron-regulated membrane protein n=1 Tax=Chryseobacterium carnipullorum TaxID=1124835 RepID=A0A376ES21_CHRCU|nr:Uncharacterized iron-regulated membrane protein [Chryseobacterium carnipullorum]